MENRLQNNHPIIYFLCCSTILVAITPKVQRTVHRAEHFTYLTMSKLLGFKLFLVFKWAITLGNK